VIVLTGEFTFFCSSGVISFKTSAYLERSGLNSLTILKNLCSFSAIFCNSSLIRCLRSHGGGWQLERKKTSKKLQVTGLKNAGKLPQQYSLYPELASGAED
jgi:hypothetical protein